MPHGATVSGFYTYKPFLITLSIFRGFLHNPKEITFNNSWISTIKRICQHCIFQEMQLVLVYLLFLKYLLSNSSLTYPQNRTLHIHQTVFLLRFVTGILTTSLLLLPTLTGINAISRVKINPSILRR